MPGYEIDVDLSKGTFEKLHGRPSAAIRARNAKVAPCEDSQGYRRQIGHPRFHRPYRCCQLVALIVHLALSPIYLAFFILLLVIVLPVYCCVPSARLSISVLLSLLKLFVCYVIETSMPMLSRTYSRIPLDAEEITVDYLNSLPGVRGEAPITEVWSKDSATQGAMSQTRFLKLKRSGGVDDQEITVKFAPRDLKTRLTCHLAQVTEKEHVFYTVIQPKLEIDTPACLHSEYSTSTALSILIMEKVEGQFFDQNKINSGEGPVTTENVEGLCRVSADFHARFWDADRIPECDQFSKLDFPLLGMMEGRMATSWPRFKAIMNRKRPEFELSPELDRVWALLSLDGVSPAWIRRCVRGPLTLTHGDLRWDNIYIRKGSDTPGLLDWQGIFKKGPAFDFSWNFLSVGNAKWIEENEERLIRDVYLPRLHAACERARAEYPFELAWDDYRAGLIILFKQMVVVGVDWFDAEVLTDTMKPILDIMPILFEMVVRLDIAGFMVKFIEDYDIPVAAENQHLLEPEKIQMV